MKRPSIISVRQKFKKGPATATLASEGGDIEQEVNDQPKQLLECENLPSRLSLGRNSETILFSLSSIIQSDNFFLSAYNISHDGDTHSKCINDHHNASSLASPYPSTQETTTTSQLFHRSTSSQTSSRSKSKGAINSSKKNSVSHPMQPTSQHGFQPIPEHPSKNPSNNNPRDLSSPYTSNQSNSSSQSSWKKPGIVNQSLERPIFKAHQQQKDSRIPNKQLESPTKDPCLSMTGGTTNKKTTSSSQRVHARNGSGSNAINLLRRSNNSPLSHQQLQQSPAIIPFESPQPTSQQNTTSTSLNSRTSSRLGKQTPIQKLKSPPQVKSPQNSAASSSNPWCKINPSNSNGNNAKRKLNFPQSVAVAVTSNTSDIYDQSCTTFDQVVDQPKQLPRDIPHKASAKLVAKPSTNVLIQRKPTPMMVREGSVETLQSRAPKPQLLLKTPSLPATVKKAKLPPKQSKIASTIAGKAKQDLLQSQQNTEAEDSIKYIEKTQKFSTIGDPRAFLSLDSTQNVHFLSRSDSKSNYYHKNDSFENDESQQPQEIEEDIETDSKLFEGNHKQPSSKNEEKAVMILDETNNSNDHKLKLGLVFSKPSLAVKKDESLERDTQQLDKHQGQTQNQSQEDYNSFQCNESILQQTQTGFFKDQIAKIMMGSSSIRPFTPPFQSNAIHATPSRKDHQSVISQEDCQLELVYDDILNCYYDPKAKLYYDIKS